MGSLRHTFRRLARAPLFTAISLLTLALGIGANTAIFSVIEGVLLKPLPHPHPEHLVAVWHSAPGVNLPEINMAPSLYFTYREESRTFQDVAMWNSQTSSVTGLAEPEEVPVISATYTFLPMLGIQPVLGRPFRESDDHPKSERVTMLSDGYWRIRFGGDPKVIGRRIMVDGDPREVIGVLPASFQFMDRKVSLIIPMRFDRSEVHLGNFSYQGVARLKPGATLAQASADVARMIPLSEEKFPAPPGFSLSMFRDARLGPNLRLLQDHLVGDAGATLWVLMGTVGMVLLIACANVANLLLVRADGRRQEFAIRAALGAGWTRIARELLIESLVLGVVGGALGLALAYAALRALVASEISHLPRLANIGLDPAVLAFTLAISLAAGLVFGLVPVLKYARPHIAAALRGGGRSLSQSKDRHRARSILVVVQVALALVLLVSSGLMIRTFQALRHVDPGFRDAHNVQTLRISIPAAQAKEPEQVIRMQQEMMNRLAALNGVSSVAATTAVPMAGDSSNDPIYAEDHSYREGSIPPIRRFKNVSPGYPAVMGARMIAGRDFTWNEVYSLTPVAMISENMARELWTDPRVAIGKRIRPTTKDDWYTIVGVISDERSDGVNQKAPASVFWPLMLKNFEGNKISVRRYVAFVLRTPRAGSGSLLEEARRAIWSVNANLPLATVKTLQELYDASLARTSFTLLLLAISGGMALLLGVVGIYGVISYSVAQRTREIGIRLALGAPLSEVTGMFVWHGLVLSAIGAACGLAAAFALTRLMKSILFEVSAADPLTYGAVSIVLIAAAVLASYLPARRATTIDPSEALRAE